VVDGGGLENVDDRLYQDGYISPINFTEDPQIVARLCAILSVFEPNPITDRANFARNSLI
jgi:hypothetical protein